MTPDQMRAAIYDVYPGRKWQKKVEKMHDDQVIAVYYKFLHSGKFDEEKKEPRKTKTNPRSHGAKQISIFDL